MIKDFGLLLWQALRKFIDDNGFFLSSGITFNILINLIPYHDAAAPGSAGWHSASCGLLLKKISRRMGKSIEIIQTSVMNALQNYQWPGNVRELEGQRKKRGCRDPWPQPRHIARPNAKTWHLKAMKPGSLFFIRSM
jgi:hypothetical protein